MTKLYQSAKHAFSKTYIYLSLFSAVITIIGIIGFENIIENLWYRIISVVVLFKVSYIIALIVCYFRSNVSIKLGNDRILVVEYDYLFSKQGVVVIPFNRFFDTVVNDKILNEHSVAGQFIKNCFAGNLEELDKQISLALNNVEPDYTRSKPGKENAYPIGTVVKVQKGANHYFCVAQTDVDSDFKSMCDIEMLHKTMMEILKFINKEANGRKVYMPLLGAGFSRLNKQKQVILEYLVSILKTADIPLQSELHIVLREAEREFIDLAKCL